MAMATGTKGAMADINVTPLVDVVLVLLIIFMVLTPLLQMGYDVNVPPKKTALASEISSRQQLIVTMMQEDSVFLNREQVPVTQLAQRLTEILKNRSDKTVFFAGGDEVNYGAVMAVMDTIRNAGAEKIGIVTENVSIPG
jgi:biopolymer transport protein TolR